jgi:phosphatidate cytidylyltransferase
MAGPPDERARRPEDEDLFEDLDEFFAPIEDLPDEEAFPEEARPPAANAPRRPAAEQGTDEATEEPLEEFGVDIDIPEEDELLSSGPLEQREDSAAEAETLGEAAEAASEGREEGAEEAPEPVGAEGPSEEGVLVGEDTADMSGEEWDRLRTEAEMASEPDVPSGPEEVDAAERESRGLTLDALRMAPPEYADLPRAEEGSQEGTEGGSEEGEEPVLEEEAAIGGSSDMLQEEAEEADQGGTLPSDEEPGVAPELEPQPDAVEAAAEHFATGMRESPEEVERELLADLDEAGPVETVTIEPGGPGAGEGPPTWEEGGERVVEEAAAEAEVPPAPGGRNLTAAFASGILLAAAVIALLAVGKGPFTVLVGAIVLFGQAEFYAVMRSRRLHPATLLGLVGGGLMIAGAYFRGVAAVSLGLFLTMALTVLWYMAALPKARQNTTVNAGVTILGAVYVPFLASFAILLLILPGDLGRNIFLVVVGLTILYDVCAYAIGSLWGSLPLAPTISPQKSWEGVIGATFLLLLVSLAIVPSIEPFDASRAVGLALVIAVAAPLGDLVESALKRDLGVKDMGAILPGHGGILDRIDAILFSAPAAYYFLQLSF